MYSPRTPSEINCTPPKNNTATLEGPLPLDFKDKRVVVGALDGSQPSLDAPNFSRSCGKCRQKLMEFSSLCGYDLDILEGLREPGVYKLRQLSELLPASFGPANIGVDLKKYRG